MTIHQAFLRRSTNNKYDDDITITAIPKGYFPAMTSSRAPAEDSGSTTRQVRIELFPLEQSPGGTMVVGTGLYLRRAWEHEVQVTVFQEDRELVTQTQSYPAE